ncbi:3-hydroxyacyl-CoA dehydrogenase family protein [Salipaludibacillus agaradhaerens]|nr:3-hydroxyacyl-CoA dehydrogenase family protein [Salipaludibacillus agaradhaerens]MCR6117842.1 3-hydroxyacyl-CoA dehydrogenase family protein [Salipaludibacillus agaradhaerens]
MKVGVIGAGVMGVGVSIVVAQKGMKVILLDISNERLDLAKKEIEKNLRLLTFYSREISSSTESILELIEFTTDYERLNKASFIVENTTEKWEIKEAVYKKINSLKNEDCVIAANTSALSITKLGQVMNKPERVIGMHFMNPVPLKPAVEVIKGYYTSQKTIDISYDFLELINKEGILINDSPGFVSNRVLMLTINEAIFLLHDQVASPSEVDEIFKKCFGHKMGPLETADLIGLDTILLSLEVLYDSFLDSKFRPCPLLKKMVDASIYGRKSGKGFYEYRVPQNV